MDGGVYGAGPGMYGTVGAELSKGGKFMWAHSVQDGKNKERGASRQCKTLHRMRKLRCCHNIIRSALLFI